MYNKVTNQLLIQNVYIQYKYEMDLQLFVN